jgi:hypothetical protein
MAAGDGEKRVNAQRIDTQSLLGWAPPQGLLSIYLDIDPADRGDGWHTELRNGLAGARDEAVDEDHESRLALEATTERVLERLGVERPREEGRARVGFVEIARKGGRETWHSLQPAPPWTGVVRSARPFLLPLIAMLDEGEPRGVAVLSAERVRLLEWSLEHTEELESFEVTLLSGDWRERKAQRSADPAHMHGASASGKDQYGQRLDENRRRFLKEIAGRAAEEAKRRDWAELLVCGPEPLADEFAGHIDAGLKPQSVDSHDLISEPVSKIGGRIGQFVAALNRDRELALVERVEAAAHAPDNRAALGPQETLESLLEGRVEHVLLDGGRDYRSRPLDQDLAYEPSEHGDLPLVERMVELALSTSARLTPVEGEAAERLERHGGVAGLLRY